MTQFAVTIKCGSRFLPCANLGSTNPPKCREVGTFSFIRRLTPTAIVHSTQQVHLARPACTPTVDMGPTHRQRCTFWASVPHTPSPLLLGEFLWVLSKRGGTGASGAMNNQFSILGQFRFGKSYWLHPVVLGFCSSSVYCGNRGFCWCEGRRVCGGI